MSTTFQPACDRGMADARPRPDAASPVTHPRLVLATTVLASSLAFVDGSVINVGLPAIARSFPEHAVSLSWIVSGYLLPLSALLLIGGAAGLASLWSIARGYRLLRGRDGMGGGDPKLFGAIGLWLGWQMLPSVLLLAGLLGLGIVLFRKLTGRPVARDDALPLGTLLAAAAYPAWLAMIDLTP